MFGIGFGEILLILIVVLIIFGPEQLPNIATNIGRLLNKLRTIQSDLHSYANQHSGVQHVKQISSQIKQQLEMTTLQENCDNSYPHHNYTSNSQSISKTSNLNNYDESILTENFSTQPELDFNSQPELFDKQ